MVSQSRSIIDSEQIGMKFCQYGKMSHEELRVLLLSDLHAVVPPPHLLGIPDLDAMILTGDLACFDPNQPEQVDLPERQLQEVLRGAASRQIPVFWLPGNHDPPSAFLDGNVSSVNSSPPHLVTAVHGQSRVQLAPGLLLGGVGGAVPATQAGNFKWAGYPYSSQDDMADPLTRMWQRAAPHDDGSQWLILTHCGPAEISTSVAIVDASEPPILSGSVHLRQFLSDATVQRTVIANIHGHTHDASGLARVGNVAIINPGALVENRYALLHLARINGRWQIKSVRFESI